MKKVYIRSSILSLAMLALSTLAFAGGNSNNSDIINNYGDVNTYNQPTAVGVGLGIGLGLGGAGGAGGNAIATATGGLGGAGGNANVVNNNDVRNTNTNTNTNVNANTLHNTQGQQQGQGQIQGQGQQQSIENSGNNVGTSSADVNVTFQSAKSYRPPVNSAIAPTIFPTAPCMGSTSGGVTGTLLSISGGSSWTSEECMILETARSFDQAGFAADGLAVRCQGKWAKNAPSCLALNKPATPAPTVSKSAPAPAPVAKATEKKTVAKIISSEPVKSENGYYSTVTNPLAK